MADDTEDWLSGGADEPAAPEPAAPAAEGGGEEGGEEGGAEEEITLEDEEEEEVSPKKKDRSERRQLYRVWKRPVFLQYSYLYDYRHNYYDDVIDYLDRRQRGLSRDIPRPQTWAERALRTFSSRDRYSATYEKREKDINLLSDMRTSARFYNYHSKEYMTQRYSKYF